MRKLLIPTALIFAFSLGCQDDDVAGIAPVIGVDPGPVDRGEGGACTAGTLDFGDVELDVTQRLPVTLRNEGNGDLRVTAITIVSDDADPPFTLEEITLPLTLEPAATFEITVIYLPETDGDHSATLRIEAEGAECSSVEVPVTGQGQSGEVEVCLSCDGGTEQCNTPGTDLEADFGAVPVGESRSCSVEVHSQGEVNVRVPRVAQGAGQLSAEYALQGAGGAALPFPADIPMGQSVTFEIVFTPTDGRPDEGTLELPTNDADEDPVRIVVRGNGDAPAICPEPLSVDFGDVGIGVTETRTLTITSCGTQALIVDAAAITTNSASDEFVIAAIGTALPATLQPEETLTVELSYTPLDVGEDDGELSVDSNDPLSPVGRIALLGRGTTLPSCDMGLQPGTLDFGPVAAGMDAQQSFTLFNAGSADCMLLEIDPIVLGRDATAGEFELLMPPMLPRVFEPGDLLELSVRYAPVDDSADTATLVLRSDETNEPDLELLLLGNGGRPPTCKLQVEPRGGFRGDGLLAFGQVNLGDTKTLDISFTNIGEQDCEIVSAAYDCSFFAQFMGQCDPPLFAVTSNVQQVIRPGETGAVPVSFTPVGVGSVGIDNSPLEGLGHQVQVRTTDLTHTPPSIANPIMPPQAGDFIIALSGGATQADIDVLPPELDFGAVTLGCRSPENGVRVYNLGSESLNITELRIEGDDAASFELSQAPILPHEIMAGQNLGIFVIYRPSGVVTEDAVLVIISDDMNEPETRIPMRGEGVETAHQVERFEVSGVPQVDVLFVIDNSGSMGDEQENLATNFASFIAAATSTDPPVDFHIGVTSTQVEAEGGPTQRDGIVPGYLFKGTQNLPNPWLEPDSPNLEAAFADMIRVGTCCSSSQEAGMQAGHWALSDPLISDVNAGFLREDAKLSVIFVSDEPDQSHASVDFYFDFFQGLKGFRRTNLFDASAIIPVPMGAVPSGRYADLVLRSGGLARPIETNNWGRDLADLGVLAFGVQIDFVLSREALANSVTVSVDEAPLEADPDTSWSYYSPTNSVIFAPTAAPNPGAAVQIEYDVACLQ